MQLRNPEHHDIFYPSDSQVATALCDPQEKHKDDLPVNCLAAGLPAALLVPHAAWQWILPQLRQALATASGLSPKRIVLLAPLHQQVVLHDMPNIAFMPSQDGAMTPTGIVRFAVHDRESLLKDYDGVVDIQDGYFTEEPGVEVLYPLLAMRFPQTPVLPILAAGGCSSAQCKSLSALLRNLLQSERETLFIITANMSDETTRQKAWEQAKKLQDLLGLGQSLLEAKAQGAISSCGLQWLDALERLPWQSSGWMMLSATNDGEKFYNEVPLQDIATDDKRHVVWHGVALHR
ncbi:MAG: AmmeMemoRadiSam system protein B [Sphaerochaetaceae bacterium]|nr:AmmeMemoRadiSam system protein B [Sphaerochaetaceae bacterium]